jgi:hypothetical protein
VKKNALYKTTLCSVEGCGKPYSSRGYCRFHHSRWYQTGNALTPLLQAPRYATNDIQTLRAYLKHAGEPQESGCINWKFAANNSGYGTKWYKGVKTGSHVLAYKAFVDESFEQSSALVIMHSCDNRRCINPEHLKAGTSVDNIQDAISKGRINRDNPHSIGAMNPKAKLTEAVVPWLRQMMNYGVSPQALAEVCGVTTTTMYGVKNRKFWKHV